MGWRGTARLAFKSVLNRIGNEDGITFKGGVKPSVDFLDARVRLITDGMIKTKLFVKPTDVSRYLHRRSGHGPHTFRSMAYSQCRRAVVICSDTNGRSAAIEYMTEKFLNSGYKKRRDRHCL